jgi:hypothetical protein
MEYSIPHMKMTIFALLLSAMSNVPNSVAQSTNTNSFPAPIVGEASSPRHIDPVMYVKDYCQYGSVDSINYAQSIRFVKYKDEIYMVSYVYNYKIEDKTKNHFGFWAKIESVSDYMTIKSDKNKDVRIYVDGDSLAVRNPVFIGGYKPCYQGAGFKFLEAKSGKFKNDETHCLLIPVSGSSHGIHSTAFDTLALVPEKDLGEWLHTQYKNGKDQGRFNIEPLSLIYHYDGNIKKFLERFN